MERKHWIDNLRWATVLLVLFYHVIHVGILMVLHSLSIMPYHFVAFYPQNTSLSPKSYI